MKNCIQLFGMKRFLVSALAGFTLAAHAQTITLGTGTATNTYDGYPAAYGAWYTGARHQMVYPKAELQAASAVNGLITQVGFNVAALNGSGAHLGYTIKLMQTSATTLSTYITTGTTVFTATSYTPVVGWNMHTLSTPFLLDTSMSLVIEVCFSNGINNYTYNASTYMTTGMAAGTTIYNRSDNAGNGCPMTTVLTGAVTTSRPNARIVITPATPMTYSTTYLTQNTNPIQAGSVNQQIIGMNVVTTGATSPLSITQFNLNTTGTSTASYITRARIFRTTTNVFDTLTPFGSINNPSGSFNITGSATLSADTNYFWLTYNIAPGATAGSTFDAELTQVTVGGTGQTVSPTSVAGNRTLLAPLTGSYMVGAGQTYTTLPAAINDLLYRGISGAVTFSLTDALYTLTSTLDIPAFTNPGNNTVTIKPFLGVNPVITGSIAGAPLIRILASRVTIDGSNFAGTVTRDMTISNTSSTAGGVVAGFSNGTTLTAITVKNAIVINGVNTSSGIIFSDIAGGSGLFSNITVYNNDVRRAYHGVIVNGTSSIGINVDSNTINSTGTNQSRMSGVAFQGVTGGNIRKNVIGNFSNSDAETKQGIWLNTGCMNIVIEKNRITNIGTTASANAGHGIKLITGSLSSGISIRNNMIDSIYGTGDAGTVHSLTNPSGIVLSGTQSGVQIVYNTIRMGGSTLNNTYAASAGIHLLAGSLADVRNNFIKNSLGLSAGSGVGTFAIAVETGTSQFSLINNNNYWASAPGSGVSAIGRIGATNYTTLAAWKGAVTADGASVSENTQVVSATDPHVQSFITSQMKNGATPIAGITTDFDEDSRNATTPDIGADEFNGFPQDVTGPGISYTPLSNGAGTSTRVLTGFATITDASGVNTTAGTKPRIYYKKSSEANVFGVNSNAASGWKYAEASNSTSPFSFTIDYSLLFTAAAVGDTIVYFVVAQDNASPSNVSANPSVGFAGSDVATISSAPTTPNRYIITPSPLSGPYNVGAGQAYTTLTAAMADLSLRGVSNAVTFNLTDVSYSGSETFPITINTFPGTSAANKVTIKPTLANTSISGSSTSCIIKFNGASYVTINGAISGSTRNLTISNTNTGSGTAAILMASNGIGQGCMADTLMNLNVQGGSITAGPSYGVYMGSGTIGTGGADNMNIGMINCGVTRVYYGLGVDGTGTNPAAGITIRSCSFGSNTATDYIGFSGIRLTYVNNSSFSQDSIFNIMTTSTNPVAFLVGTGVTNTVINRNVIDSIRYTGTSGYGARGIIVGTGNAASNVTISNNVIARIGGDGWSGINSDNIIGIAVGITTSNGTITTGGINLYYNTLWISQVFAGYATTTNCLGFYVSSTASALDVRNNIFMNTSENTVGTTGTKSYAFYSQAAPSAYSQLNYNDYVVGGSQGVLAFMGGSDQTTLTALKAATGKDVNSVSYTTNHVSTGNLHLTGASVGNLTLKAAPAGGITTDIDGETRNATWHYMGADEIPASPLPVAMDRLAAFASGNDAVVYWSTSSEINNSHFVVERSVNGTDFVATGTVKGAGNSNKALSYSFTDVNAANAGSVVFYRLTQYDRNGVSKTSEVVSVNFNVVKTAQVVAYPNPFGTTFNIGFSSATAASADVVVTSLQGKTIYHATVNATAGFNVHPIALPADLTTGIYLVKLTSAGESTVLKVNKQ